MKEEKLIERTESDKELYRFCVLRPVNCK